MKPLLRLLLLLAGCLFLNNIKLKAQEYYPILKDNRHWIYTKMAAGEDPPLHIVDGFSLSIEGDTIINNLDYKKLIKHSFELNSNSTEILEPKNVLNSSLYALIRENTFDRSVFFIPYSDLNSMCEVTEHLLYDFNLHQNDTLNNCVLDKIYEPWLNFVPIIDSIWEDKYLGLDTRIFFTSGIFSNYGDLSIEPGFLLEGFGYEKHGIINFGRESDLFLFQYFCEGDSLGCDLISNIAIFPKINKNKIELCPNPASDILNISFDPPIENENTIELHIYNSIANRLYSSIHSSMNKINLNVSNLDVGRYFIHIRGDNFSDVMSFVICR